MKKHPFSFTLGPGPYQFMGCGEICFSEVFGARYNGPCVERGAGTCAHCGTAIVNVYVVRTSEKRDFGVGSDCIRKLGQKADFTNFSAFEKAVRDHNRNIRKTRELKQTKDLKAICLAMIEANKDILVSLPHPSAYYSEEGKTLKDYFDWCVQSASSVKNWKNLKSKIEMNLKKVS